MSALPWVDVMKELGHYDVGNPQSVGKPQFVGASQSGILVVGHKYSNTEISFSQKLELERAEKIGATAVYFQQFPDTGNSLSDFRPASPQIYIFDKSETGITDDALSEIHKKLWSGSIVPIYYVLGRTHVKIYSARRPIELADDGCREIAPRSIDNCAFADIAGSEEIIRTYHAKMFRTGEFWRQPSVKRYFDNKDTVGEKLLQEIRGVRKEIKENFPLNLQNTITHLLMLGIFVKYLEERRDSQGNRVLPEKFFRGFNASSFCEAVRKKRLAGVLQALATQFNGKVFELDHNMKKGVRELNANTHLRSCFADFLDARADNRQYVLWRLYDFNYIPVELISRIYEEFISSGGSKPGVAYTPVNLANLMIDECMPLHQPKQSMKICDPSCGSGIFLVTAFRRMAHWLQYKEYQRTGRVRPLKPKELTKIMRDSIHGYDIVEMAVNLSMFSLSIAMCDMLEPTEIWVDLKFDNMREENLMMRDFFASDMEEGKFDLIIGNPPFEDVPSEKKKDFLYPNQALIFLGDSMRLLKKGGHIAFVMPAIQILYRNQGFREGFFHEYCVEQIMDFSFFRGELFEKKNVSAVVLFAKKETPDHDNTYVRHIVVRRTFNATRRIMFEIDAYDFHQVPLRLVKDHRVWKSNLLGGAVVYSVVRKLANCTSLGEILRTKKEWVCSEGYIIGNKERKPAEWMQDYDTILDWTDDGIGETGKIEESSFACPRNERLFESPHLIIRKTLGVKGVIAEVDRYRNLRFSAKAFGIHPEGGGRKKRLEELDSIARSLRVNREVHKFFLMSTSYRAGIGRGAGNVMQTSDIMSIPVHANGQTLSLTWDEKIVVDDVLDYGDEALSRKQDLKIDVDASSREVDFYTEVYCRWLNHGYANKISSFCADSVESGNGAICVIFQYCKKRNLIWPKDIKEKIANNDFTFVSGDDHLSAVYKRIFVWSGAENTVIYIKPKARRYWLGSVALRDAAGFLHDMVTQNDMVTRST